MGRLLADVRAYVRRGRTRDVSGMLGKLVETSQRVCTAISTHMQREEAEVLPLLAAQLGAAEQRAIVWHTLRWVMPAYPADRFTQVCACQPVYQARRFMVISMFMHIHVQELSMCISIFMSKNSIDV